MLTYFVLGSLIGIVTGIPIGPVNLAVIDAAYRHRLRRAVAVGMGGAFADGLYATAGILGLGPLVSSHPAVSPILYAVSGLVLVVYGGLTVRSQPVTPALPGRGPGQERGQNHVLAGFSLGVALIVLNPAAIVTWVVVVGSFIGGVTRLQGLAAALGIAAGSCLWFTLVAYLTDRGKAVLGERAIWITRMVGLLLVGYGLFSLLRAAYYVATSLR